MLKLGRPRGNRARAHAAPEAGWRQAAEGIHDATTTGDDVYDGMAPKTRLARGACWRAWRRLEVSTVQTYGEFRVYMYTRLVASMIRWAHALPTCPRLTPVRRPDRSLMSDTGSAAEPTA